MNISPDTQATFNTLCTSLDKLTPEELQLLKREIDQRLQNTAPEIDLLDVEYMEQVKKEVKEAISLQEARGILAKISSSLSETIIAEREDRF